MDSGNKEQWIDSIIQEKNKKVHKYWMYASIILAMIIAFGYLSNRYPYFNFNWVLYAGMISLVGYAIHYYFKKSEEPSYEKMVSTVREEMFKMGRYMNLEANNISLEPLGNDYFALRIEDESLTFMIYKNRMLGSTAKHISDLQQDINKQGIQQILAQKGLIQVIE